MVTTVQLYVTSSMGHHHLNHHNAAGQCWSGCEAVLPCRFSDVRHKKTTQQLVYQHNTSSNYTGAHKHAHVQRLSLEKNACRNTQTQRNTFCVSARTLSGNSNRLKETHAYTCHGHRSNETQKTDVRARVLYGMGKNCGKP